MASDTAICRGYPNGGREFKNYKSLAWHQRRCPGLEAFRVAGFKALIESWRKSGLVRTAPEADNVQQENNLAFDDTQTFIDNPPTVGGMVPVQEQAPMLSVSEPQRPHLTMSSDSDVNLPSSKLGTKEHWDSVYGEELTNFGDFGDEGEIWFGPDTVDKMVSWTTENVPLTSSPAPSIIEIGTGNGNLLFALAEAGYASERLVGVDYSADAVRLARAIAPQRGAEGVNFAEVDFLRDELPDTLGVEGVEEGWDLVLDKGTYDAMALMEKDESGSRPCDAYPTRIASIVRPGGYFLITSCNFTHDELLRVFSTSKTMLSFHSCIEHPSISFGGKKGSTYCSVAFRKLEKEDKD